MPPTLNKMIGDPSGKPILNVMYAAIESYAPSLGSATKHLAAQVSFPINRKSPWVQAHERAGDGTLFLNMRFDCPVEGPHVYHASRVGANGWDHHVVIKTMETAQSDQLRDLIRIGHEFAVH